MSTKPRSFPSFHLANDWLDGSQHSLLGINDHLRGGLRAGGHVELGEDPKDGHLHLEEGEADADAGPGTLAECQEGVPEKEEQKEMLFKKVSKLD